MGGELSQTRLSQARRGLAGRPNARGEVIVENFPRRGLAPGEATGTRARARRNTPRVREFARQLRTVVPRPRRPGRR